MNRSLSREHDYTFGRLMFALRTAIGLTQQGLAEFLGVSRHAVGGWEAGRSYPKAEHLKHIIALGVQQHGFAAGQEAEQIRTFWQAARQKVLLDEQWLQTVLSSHTSSAAALTASAGGADSANPSRRASEPHVDWEDALDVPAFYGRSEERAALTHWIVAEQCRVVSIVGMGGIGKSALATSVMREVAPQFDVVIWRSLRDAPACAALLDDCLQLLVPDLLPSTPASLDGYLLLFMEQLRTRRVLLVLDNAEVLVKESSHLHTGAEAYSLLLRRVGETAHQSCLLLTSREKLADLAPLEGSRSPVRTLQLAGLDAPAAVQLLAESDVIGSASDRERLVALYQGNPLALKIVVQTIVELFGGDLAVFLQQGEIIFGGVRALLDEQFARLSPLDTTLCYWLAIMREPARTEELLAALNTPVAPGAVLDALNTLRRRSLLEQGKRAGSFTLHGVVLEYTMARLVAELSDEVEQGTLARFLEFALCQAQAKEYLRKTQEQLLVAPLLARLRFAARSASIEVGLLHMLDTLRSRHQRDQGYGPANVVALLRSLRGHLRGLDLSGLALRGVSFQHVETHGTLLTGAALRDCVFTEPFDAITAVAINSMGTYWAAASREGGIRIWSAGDQTLRRAWRAHTGLTYALAWSTDGTKLASGSWDRTVKLWDADSGTLLWSGRHAGHANSVAFSPDGRVLASSGDDGLVCFWDVQNGALMQSLPHHDLVISIAWSPDGRLLATGDVQGHIRLWTMQPGQAPAFVQTFDGQSAWVDGLAFSPDGSALASASNDGTVRLWSSSAGQLRRTLVGHTNRVTRIAWSRDGRTLASGSFDQTIMLWDVERGSVRATLRGHTAVIVGVAFTPDNRLLSGSEDGSLRLWDAASGVCERIIQGYATLLYDVDWSPDGRHLVSVGSDTLVTLFDALGAAPPRVLHGHNGVVYGVSWSPDGRRVASSELDNAIRLWDGSSGELLALLAHPHDPGNFFYGLAWSPDGQRLAAGTFRHGVYVFEMPAQRGRGRRDDFPTWVRPVAWSPDGTLVGGGGDDGAVYVWEADGELLRWQLMGHTSKVTSVAWSADGAHLASASGGTAGGELFVWYVRSGERVRELVGHPELVAAVAWSPDGDTLITGSSDGVLRWWSVASGQCVRLQDAHVGTVQALAVNPNGLQIASCGDDGAIRVWDVQTGEGIRTLRRERPYERMEITGVSGISDVQRAALLALGAVEQPAKSENVAARIPGSAVSKEPTSRPRPANVLPAQSTLFVGRSEELAAITRLLANSACRLLTLIGPGGIGKTRLALQVALLQSAAFADGAAFVPLASVDSPHQIVSAISDALGLAVSGTSDPTSTLLKHLSGHHMLLVLDDFEHLLAGADLVSEILARAPRVKLIATSRTRLNLQAEWLFNVDGLEYPADDAPSAAQLAGYSAVQLFVQRATQVRPALRLDDVDYATIIRICQHVVGMPLAIELAATATRMLPLAEIERQIRASADTLVTTLRDVPPRHRSLRAVFDHSWRLLNERQQVLLSRLAVFRSGWTEAAAAAVADANLLAITALVDTSLVRQSTTATQTLSKHVIAKVEPRWTLLEPLREYALERLVERGEAPQIRRAHAAYYGALAEAVAAQWGTPAFDTAITQLQREHDNIRAALSWAYETGAGVLGLRLAGALWQFWRSYGYISEGRIWLGRFLALDADNTGPATIAERQRALHAAAWLAFDQHDYEQAAQLFQQSTALLPAGSGGEGDTELLLNRARQARAEGHYQRATTLMEQALAWHRAQGHDTARGSIAEHPALYTFGQVLRGNGLVTREQGDFAKAAALFGESLAFHRAVGDSSCVAFSLIGLADIERDQGHADLVQAYAGEALALLRELGMQWAIGFALNTLALGAMYADDLPHATALIRESETVFRTLQSDASLAEVLVTKGKIERAKGEVAAARTTLLEALRLALAVGPRLFVAASLEMLGTVVTQQGFAHQAAHLFAAAATLRTRMGAPMWPADQEAVAAATATVRATLGENAFAATWTQVHAMPTEELLGATRLVAERLLD